MTFNNSQTMTLNLDGLTEDPSRLAVLVDVSPVMKLHRQDVAEVLRAAEHAGSPVFTFTPDPPTNTDNGAERVWPLGRPLPADLTAALVVTDTRGRGWQQDRFRAWLAELGSRTPLCLLHLLDRSAWSRGPLPPVPMRLDGTHTNDPAAWSPLHPDDTEPPGEDTVVLPVLPFPPGSPPPWAEPSPGWEADVYALPRDGRRDDELPVAPAPVDRFLARASHGARELAVRLAQAPVNIPVAECVQQGIPRGYQGERAERTEIAEVLGSELMDPTRPVGDLHDPADAALDFLPGVRRELLGRLGDLSTMRSIFFSLGVEFKDTARIYQWLARLETGAPLAPDVPREEAPLARAVLPALREMPGEYRRFAERLAAALGLSITLTPPAPPPRTRTHQNVVPEETRQPARGEPHQQRSLTARPREEHRSPVATNDPLTQDFSGPEPARISAERTRRLRRRSSAQLRGVPPHNMHFTGRAEFLEHIRASFDAPDLHNGLYLLTGGGGYGKTQIAIQYAHQHRDDYDLIWWFPANADTDVQQAYLQLARHLGLEGDLGNLERTIQRVHEALESDPKIGYWLLIFDDVEDLEKLGNQGIPSGRGGDILLTSRQQTWLQDGVSDGKRVSELPPEESINLLRSVCPHGLEDDHIALAIARKLEHFPLALAQMGAYLRDSLLSPERFLEQLNHEFPALLEEVGPDTQYNKPLVAAWNVQLENLRRGAGRDRDLKRMVREFIQLCSFFAPRPLPRTLFHRARGLSAGPELSRLLGDDRALTKVLRYLSRHSLAEFDHSKHTFQLHASFQAVVQRTLENEDRVRFRDLVHRLLAQSDPLGPELPQNWPEYRLLFAHVQASEAWRSRDIQVRGLVRNVIVYLLETGNPVMAQNLADSSIESWYDDVSQRLEVQLFRNRALRLRGHNQTALEEADRMLVEQQELEGEESEEVLEARRARAVSLSNLGHFRDSLEEFRTIHRRRTELYSAEDESTLVAAHDLAVGLRLLFRFQEALVMDQENLRRRRYMFGHNGIPTLRSQVAIGIGLLGLGRMTEAEQTLDECLRRFESADAAQSTHSAHIPLFQSVLQRRIGNHDRALELSQSVVDALYLRNQLRNRSAVFIYNVHAVNLAFTQRLDEAQSLAGRLLDSADRYYPERHFVRWITRVNAAIVLRVAQRYEEAFELDRAAQAELFSLLPEENNTLPSIEINLGNDLFALGKLQEAREQDAVAVSACEEDLGEGHLFHLIARRNHLISRRALGENVDAPWTDLYEEYLAEFGPGHRHVTSMERFTRLDADVLPVSQ